MLRSPRSSTDHAIARPSDDAVRLSTNGAERIASIVNGRAGADIAGAALKAAANTRPNTIAARCTRYLLSTWEGRAYMSVTKPVIGYADFEKIDIRIGRVTAVDDFPKARKPSFKLSIDFGLEI